jgi:hypothetical protein
MLLLLIGFNLIQEIVHVMILSDVMYILNKSEIGQYISINQS